MASERGKYRIIRRVHLLKNRLSLSLFLKTIKRAIEYKAYDPSRLEGIAIYILKKENWSYPWITTDVSPC